MNTNPDDAAFSRPFGTDGQCRGSTPEFGLTKREYFAAIAMQGLLANDSYPKANRTAAWAVEQADTLIQELNRGQSDS